MVLVNAAKNRVRDLIDADFTKGRMGTGTASEVVTDVALASSTSGTDFDITTQTADKQIVVDYSLGSTAGNGNNLTELGIYVNGTSESLFSRHVFASLAKSSTAQWQISVIYKVI